MQDSYLTIKGPSYGEFRDKGSKFQAYAFPVQSGEDWQVHLEWTKKEHPKARHHCFAYRLGLDDHNFRAHDDGEPSGTAGKPILGQIDSFGLTQVIVIVVRYFGGTLLGTSGLINAYKRSAQMALEQAEVAEVILQDRIRVSFEYAWMGEVMNAVKKLHLDIVHQYFQEVAYIDLQIRQGESDEQLLRLKAALARISLEEATLMEQIPGIVFRKL